MPNYNEQLVQNIDLFLKEKQLKMEDLENYAAISSGTIDRLRSNLYESVSFDTAIRIAEFLGVSLDDLIQDNADYVRSKVLRYEIQALRNALESPEPLILRNKDMSYTFNKSDIQMLLDNKTKELKSILDEHIHELFVKGSPSES